MDYIAQTLGIKVVVCDIAWEGANRLQYFLTDAYNFKPVLLGETRCLFVKPKGELAAVSDVKKHLERIAEQSDDPLVLELETLNAKQRKALIAAHISFVVDGNQLYLPFLGVVLREQYINAPTRVETLSPTAQLTLFCYLYRGEREMHSNGLSKLFGISAMQITRAVKQLTALGLIAIRKDGVRIVMASQEDALALFTRAKPYLLNPVRKRFYVDNEALPPNLPFAGETALSEYTMLAPPRTTVYAYGSRARDLSGMDTLVDYNEQSQVEVWRYSPTVLSPKDGYVDPLSLWVAISNEDDPRLEMAKEELLAGILMGNRWSED